MNLTLVAKGVCLLLRFVGVTGFNRSRIQQTASLLYKFVVQGLCKSCIGTFEPVRLVPFRVKKVHRFRHGEGGEGITITRFGQNDECN